MSSPLARFRSGYGDRPLHLLAMLASLAVAGIAVLEVAERPLALRIGVWFVAAVVANDLVLYPLYALADRSLSGLLTRNTRRSRAASVAAVNHLRVPILLSGLLFLLFSPLILRRSEPAYGAASGLDESPYLERWLVITAVLFLGSAVLYAVRVGRQRAKAG